MYRNRIILAIVGALALLGIVVVPATSAAEPAQTAPLPAMNAADMTSRGHYPFGAHGFDGLLAATPYAGGVLAPPADLGITVAPTNPAKIAALVRQAELRTKLGITVAPADPQEIARLVEQHAAAQR